MRFFCSIGDTDYISLKIAFSPVIPNVGPVRNGDSLVGHGSDYALDP